MAATHQTTCSTTDTESERRGGVFHGEILFAFFVCLFVLSSSVSMTRCHVTPQHLQYNSCSVKEWEKDEFFQVRTVQVPRSQKEKQVFCFFSEFNRIEASYFKLTNKTLNPRYIYLNVVQNKLLFSLFSGVYCC